jgi:hypothetical protein
MNGSTTKETVFDLCKMYQLDDQALQEIVDISGVSRSVVDSLVAGNPVERAEALIVLEVLSQRTGHVWNLDNVKVPLIPTLADLSVSPGFDANLLSQQAGVPFAVVDQMLCDHPVSKSDAMKILDALSKKSGQLYTLDTVSVQLQAERQGGQSEVAHLLAQIEPYNVTH